MKNKWAGATRTEKALSFWLAGVSVLLAVVSVLLWFQLRPWATVVGTVADWVMVAVTFGGFCLTYLLLKQNARDATAREEAESTRRRENDREAAERAEAEAARKRESQRADAARVAVKWTVEESVYEGFSKDVVFTVGNSGSGPVTHAYLRLDYQTLPTWCSATPHDHIDGIFPNSSVEVRFPAYTEKFSFITEYAKGFADVIELGFRDVHGQDWRRKGKVLERVSPEEASIHNQWQLLKAPAGSN